MKDIVIDPNLSPDDMNRDQLRARAAELNIAGRGGMTAPALRSAIKQALGLDSRPDISGLRAYPEIIPSQEVWVVEGDSMFGTSEPSPYATEVIEATIKVATEAIEAIEAIEAAIKIATEAIEIIEAIEAAEAVIEAAKAPPRGLPALPDAKARKQAKINRRAEAQARDAKRWSTSQALLEVVTTAEVVVEGSCTITAKLYLANAYGDAVETARVKRWYDDDNHYRAVENIVVADYINRTRLASVTVRRLGEGRKVRPGVPGYAVWVEGTYVVGVSLQACFLQGRRSLRADRDGILHLPPVRLTHPKGPKLGNAQQRRSAQRALALVAGPASLSSEVPHGN